MFTRLMNKGLFYDSQAAESGISQSFFNLCQAGIVDCVPDEDLGDRDLNHHTAMES